MMIEPPKRFVMDKLLVCLSFVIDCKQIKTHSFPKGNKWVKKFILHRNTKMHGMKILLHFPPLV